MSNATTRTSIRQQISDSIDLLERDGAISATEAADLRAGMESDWFPTRDRVKVLASNHALESLDVGDRVHVSNGRDRFPGTVVKRTPARIHVRRDRSVALSSTAYTEAQEYRFEEGDDDAPVTVFSRRVRKARIWNGDVMESISYRPVGSDYSTLHTGWAAYRDPHF